MSSEHRADDIDLKDFIFALKKSWKIVLSVPLLVGLIVYLISSLIPPTYTASAKILPPQQQQSAAAGMLQSLGALGGLAGAAAAVKNPADQYVAFLRTRVVEDAVIHKFGLMQRYNKRNIDDTRLELETRTRVANGKDNLIAIEVDDGDPKVASNMVSAYISEFTGLLSRLAVTEAQQRRVFFEGQLQAAKVNLAASERALASSGVSSSTVNANPASAIEVVARLKAQITSTEVKLAAMRGYLTNVAPEYKQGLLELAALKEQLSKLESRQGSDAGGPNDYIGKYRDFKYHEALFDLFARQYEVARVDESREGAMVQVVDPPVPPENRSKPRKTLMAIGGALAGFLAVITVIFLRRRGLLVGAPA